MNDSDSITHHSVKHFNPNKNVCRLKLQMHCLCFHMVNMNFVINRAVFNSRGFVVASFSRDPFAGCRSVCLLCVDESGRAINRISAVNSKSVQRQQQRSTLLLK